MSAAMTDAVGEIRVNGNIRAWQGGAAADLLRALNLDPERRGLAIAVNDRVIRRGEWQTHAIRPGDRVEIVRPLAGG